MCLTPDFIMQLLNYENNAVIWLGAGPQKSRSISNYPAVKNDKGATDI
jgi:hypothetical protein